MVNRLPVKFCTLVVQFQFLALKQMALKQYSNTENLNYVHTQMEINTIEAVFFGWWLTKNRDDNWATDTWLV